MVYAAIAQLCRGNRCAITVLVLLGLAVLAILASPLYYGRISYARFGLTVYGLIPVPTLDLTVGPRGGLWFRDKSHSLSLQEVEHLLSPEVETLIVGTGWEGGMHVSSAIRELSGIEIRVLRTPAAFELFNAYRSEGKTVVLIAHSTC
jgi:hypothetical protein